MKIRNGFVTNSSSSSYTVLYEVDNIDMGFYEALVKEEFGNQGLRKFKAELIPGDTYEIPEDYATYADIEDGLIVKADKFYVEAVEWSGDECYQNEGYDVIKMIEKGHKRQVGSWGDDC